MATRQEIDIAMVKKHLNELGEHFESVHIFVTRHEPELDKGTISLQLGIGNWFTRYGQISEWLIKRNEQARIEERTPE